MKTDTNTHRHENVKICTEFGVSNSRWMRTPYFDGKLFDKQRSFSLEAISFEAMKIPMTNFMHAKKSYLGPSSRAIGTLLNAKRKRNVDLLHTSQNKL